MAVQPDAPYGLARLSHRDRGASEYVYDDVAGDDTFSYIVDSGIFVDHPEFEGRASFGANFVGDGNDDDGNGHGTHCAGTVGSRTYGVAKKTNLIAVKVMNAHGGGGSSQLLAGIDWATRDVEEKGRSGKSVANLSVGGPRGQALNRAVQAATEQGLAMFVAAGNSGQPAASFSPSSEKTACVVGAIDEDDARPSFSNYGPELAVFAPGVEIMSTWKDGGTVSLPRLESRKTTADGFRIDDIVGDKYGHASYRRTWRLPALTRTSSAKYSLSADPRFCRARGERSSLFTRQDCFQRCHVSESG